MMAAGAGLLGIVVLSGSMLLLNSPARSLAQAPTTSDSHQDDMPDQEHVAFIATDQAAQRLVGVMAEVAGEDRANNPHASIGASLLDFQLPGTQPGGLTTALADSGSCTGCHVDHIRDNSSGAMMTNGVERQCLVRAGGELHP